MLFGVMLFGLLSSTLTFASNLSDNYLLPITNMDSDPQHWHGAKTFKFPLQLPVAIASDLDTSFSAFFIRTQDDTN